MIFGIVIGICVLAGLAFIGGLGWYWYRTWADGPDW
jgi:hypothetical protein